jgi:hypothetical protein
MYLSQFSIPFMKSEIISHSYFVGLKFPNLFSDALSDFHVSPLSAIL